MSETATVSITEQPQAFTGRRIPSRAVILLLIAVVYLGAAFSPSLQDDADSTHAEAAREMYASGDFVTLHVNGIRYLEKAPLMYWAVAASYHIFGVNEFATRLPSLLAMSLLALLAAGWASRAYGQRAGLYAGVFVTTTAGYFLFTRILIPEAILSLFLAASFYFFLSALESPQRAWRWYAGYAILALAVLAKGLLALVVVGATVVAYLLLTGDWRRWREFRLGTGLLLFFAIAAPWHVLAGIRNQHFFWFYFVNEHFLRFLGKRYPVDYNKLPWYLYWTLHLVWLFPWSLYLPVAIRRLLQERKTGVLARESSFRNRTQLLCIIWASVMLGFFAFSTNQEYYTVPAYLPVLLVVAGTLAQTEERAQAQRWLVPTAAILAVISVAAAVLLAAGLWQSRHLPFVADIGSVLAQPDLEVNTLSMGHVLDLTGQSFAALRLPTALAIIALAVGPAVALWLRTRRRHMAATLATAATMGLFLVAAHTALVRFAPFLSSRNLAAQIEAEARPADHVVIYGDQAFGSSMLFYLRRPIELVNGRTTSMWFGSTYPDAPRIFLDDSGLLQAWNSAQRVFLFVPQHERAKVDSILPERSKFLLAESSGKVVYSNQR